MRNCRVKLEEPEVLGELQGVRCVHRDDSGHLLGLGDTDRTDPGVGGGRSHEREREDAVDLQVVDVRREPSEQRGVLNPSDGSARK